MMDLNDTHDSTPLNPDGERDVLRADLISRLEGVLFSLYPSGKVKKWKFLVGDVLGSPGDSLEVVLDGDKAGLWTDRATGEGGDVFDLIARHHQIDVRAVFPQVIKLARELTGRASVMPPKKQKKEALIDDLGPATAKWDYFTAEGQLIGCVYRYDPPRRRKEFRPRSAKRKKVAPSDARPLYNQPGEPRHACTGCRTDEPQLPGQALAWVLCRQGSPLPAQSLLRAALFLAREPVDEIREHTLSCASSAVSS